MLHLVPPLVSFLGHRPDLKLEAFHRLHTLFCGAAPLGPTAATRLTERLGKYDLLMQEGKPLFPNLHSINRFYSIQSFV